MTLEDQTLAKASKNLTRARFSVDITQFGSIPQDQWKKIITQQVTAKLVEGFATKNEHLINVIEGPIPHIKSFEMDMYVFSEQELLSLLNYTRGLAYDYIMSKVEEVEDEKA